LEKTYILIEMNVISAWFTEQTKTKGVELSII